MKLPNKTWILWGSVIACFLVAAWLALRVWPWTKEQWTPSLVCNLLTTGIAILVINLIVGGLEDRENKREAARKQSLENERALRKTQLATMRAHRKEMLADRRRAQRRQMIRVQANWPVRATLGLGRELMTVARQYSLVVVLGHAKQRRDAYLEHADALFKMSMLYNRFMTFKELNHLEGLRRAVKLLAEESTRQDSEDGHKATIMTALEYINVCSLTLGTAFIDEITLKEQGEFNGEKGALMRQWNVPEIRKRLREQEATEFKVTKAGT